MRKFLYYSRQKILNHPLLQSPGNRAVLILTMIIGLAIAVGIYGDYRQRRGISLCLQQGGKPIYSQGTAETGITSTTGNSSPFKRKFSVFVRCDFD